MTYLLFTHALQQVEKGLEAHPVMVGHTEDLHMGRGVKRRKKYMSTISVPGNIAATTDCKSTQTQRIKIND